MGKNRITKRKKEIIELVAEGYSDQDIADKLKISKNTARTHIQQLIYLLCLNNRAHLVTYGFRNGILR